MLKSLSKGNHEFWTYLSIIALKAQASTLFLSHWKLSKASHKNQAFVMGNIFTLYQFILPQCGYYSKTGFLNLPARTLPWEHLIIVVCLMHFSKYRLQNLFVWGISLTETPMQRQQELQNSLRSKGVVLRFGLWRLVLDCWKSKAFYFALALDGAKGLNKKWKSNGRAPECGNPRQNPRKTRGKGLQRQSMLLKSLHSLGFVIEKKRKQDLTLKIMVCQHFGKASDTF